MGALKLKITPQSRVKMHFSLTLPDATEIISTYGDEPLDFTLGEDTMEQMLEFALLGLRTGDEQDLLVSGDDVYGPRDDTLIHWLERQEFAPDQSLNPGEIIAFSTPEGEELAGTVLQVEGERVQIDFNHPLSGRQFRYRVTILDVEQAQDPDGNDTSTTGSNIS
ncbi:MAG: hypothetical protein B6D77_19330 [gamma proteobacterium symbiont of Ctena orbiculata]|nr:MAG: hypothetical protein B6D77_19330 [gamma proteobacterium symbiont of Ctena orbiculata]PVV21366.1 MAG: hypothetical protein B6D78_07925 [gamma proteobacterium symbiont of Ctena orbiculata]PVV27505.1 MAG: hypothetical protein B6D79_02055 [gamma proteobacterium symbiont of Ctena orbiculata]